MADKINLREKFALFTDQWAPKLVGRIGDMDVRLVRIQGEFIWHAHEKEDEMFFVVEGAMTMRFRDRDVELAPGEFIIVPRTTEHMPVSQGETLLMLIEPSETVNTGSEQSERTRTPEEI